MHDCYLVLVNIIPNNLPNTSGKWSNVFLNVVVLVVVWVLLKIHGNYCAYGCNRYLLRSSVYGKYLGCLKCLNDPNVSQITINAKKYRFNSYFYNPK